MGLLARKPEGSDLELVPEDTYHAICYAVVDFGTQHMKEYDIDKEKVLIGWEIPSLRLEIERDGKKLDLPRAISKQFTLSLHPKSNMRPMLESWRGKAFTKDEEAGFHLKHLLGANCMLQILHGVSKRTGDPYAYVANVSKLYQGMEKKEAENNYQYFNFDEHSEIPENIPEWMQERIRDSYEHQEWVNSDSRSKGEFETNEGNDEIPF